MSKKVLRVCQLCVCLLVMSLEDAYAQKKEPFLPNDNIQTIRQKIRQNGYSFQVRDYKKETGKNYFVPGRHPNKDLPIITAKTDTTLSIQPMADLPEKFDWRNVDGKSYIGPVRDQSSFGSCYAFAACAVAESVFNRAANRYNENCVDFSEAYLAWIIGGDYAYTEHFFGGDGADYDYYELTALTRFGLGSGLEGVCFESDLPYPRQEPDYSWTDVSSFPRIQFDGWQRVYSVDYADTTDLIKTAILTYGVVDAAVLVTEAFENYANGVYEDTNTEPDASPYYYVGTNHAIALVGWDDHPPEGGEGCWILRNSWGKEWGEDGYMRIRYKSAFVNTSACVLSYSGKSQFLFTGNPVESTRRTVTLSGFIKNNGNPVSYYFEYGMDGELIRTTPIRVLSPVQGISIYSVTETIDRLQRSRDYSYRLVLLPTDENTDNLSGKSVELDNSEINGKIEGNIVNFVYDLPSIYVNDPIYNQNCLVVKIPMEVDGNNLPSAAWVEYGLETEVPQKTEPAVFQRVQQYSIPVKDLLPSMTYQCWVAVDNGVGVTYSDPFIFDTTDFIYYDGFEEYGRYDEAGNQMEYLPWSNEYDLQNEISYHHSYNWLYMENGIGMPKVNPGSPYEGILNVCFTFDRWYQFEESYDTEIGLKGRLICSALHLNQFPQAFLHFVYAMPSWNNDTDSLRVLYRNKKDGEWKPIPGAEYTQSTDSWTPVTLELPELSAEYQIAFEGTVNFGWGIVLDEVRITESIETPVSSWALY